MGGEEVDEVAVAERVGDDDELMNPQQKILWKRRIFPSFLIASIVSLALLCLYYGSSFAPGIHDSDDPRFALSFFSDSTTIRSPLTSLKSIPVCHQNYSEIIPCLDRQYIFRAKLKLNLSLMEHYERHCPPPDRRFNCLIPPPPGYRIPIRWPASRDEVWKANIPHTHLAINKSDQNWMVVSGEKIKFPGGGTHFHKGADKYIVSIAQMLKFPRDKLNNLGNIRTVLDVGCGVASFGAYLLAHDILAMSLAPNDVHENQIQFALERGIPSTLGVLGTKRLPFPSRSFELAHCSRCRIDWLQRDGILLLELDRLLRPGGYFVYSSPEAYAHDEKNRKIWTEMSNLLRRMCWRVAIKRNQTVIWVKPSNNGCYKRRASGTLPPLCGSDDDPDVVWNMTMKACIPPYAKKIGTSRSKGSELVPWPQRLTSPPPRLEELGISPEKYHEDSEVWRWRVSQYLKLMKYETYKDTIRNSLDMRANVGGFAAAFPDKRVWVMNVVPVEESNRLKIIYDRGLIGTVHNWCESFSTYPRTYDLLHACLLLSEVEKKGCSLEDLLIEMDRVLRPLGFVIVRDKPATINSVRQFLPALRWESWVSEAEPKADALSSTHDEMILIARKKFWKNQKP